MMLLGDATEVYKQMPAGSIDAIITDPPYPKEYLPLFAKLPEIANHVLRPGGVLAVMSGQSYLPEIYASFDGLDYLWTMAYLTPGAENRIWARSIRTHWKPILVFSKGEPTIPWTMDVVISPAPKKSSTIGGKASAA